MTKFIFRAFALVSTLCICLSLRAAEPGQTADAPRELVCGDRVEMGTPFKICVYALASDKTGPSFDFARVFEKLHSINDWMSDWQPGTQLSQVNQAAGARPVKVGADLYDLMKYTLRLSEKTEGAFDPTFNAFWGLYKFKANDQREASDEEIRERLPLVNYRNVVMNDAEKSIFLKSSGMKLGLGGIGQGYGVDKMVEELRKKYPAGYVDGSGDTYFWGKKPDGTLWTTGVRDPRGGKEGGQEKVALRIYGTDFAITTSGDDEKFFMKDGRRVHHIIDPKTGRPATASRQVTVIAKRAVDADGFDTGLFVLGPQKGKKIVESVGLQAVFITDKDVTLTKGLVKKQTPWGEVYEVKGDLGTF